MAVNQSIKSWIYIMPVNQKYTEMPVTSRYAQVADEKKTAS